MQCIFVLHASISVPVIMHLDFSLIFSRILQNYFSHFHVDTHSHSSLEKKCLIAHYYFTWYSHSSCGKRSERSRDNINVPRKRVCLSLSLFLMWVLNTKLSFVFLLCFIHPFNFFFKKMRSLIASSSSGSLILT